MLEKPSASVAVAGFGSKLARLGFLVVIVPPLFLGCVLEEAAYLLRRESAIYFAYAFEEQEAAVGLEEAAGAQEAVAVEKQAEATELEAHAAELQGRSAEEEAAAMEQREAEAGMDVGESAAELAGGEAAEVGAAGLVEGAAGTAAETAAEEAVGEALLEGGVVAAGDEAAVLAGGAALGPAGLAVGATAAAAMEAPQVYEQGAALQGEVQADAEEVLAVEDEAAAAASTDAMAVEETGAATAEGASLTSLGIAAAYLATSLVFQVMAVGMTMAVGLLMLLRAGGAFSIWLCGGAGAAAGGVATPANAGVLLAACGLAVVTLAVLAEPWAETVVMAADAAALARDPMTSLAQNVKQAWPSSGGGRRLDGFFDAVTGGFSNAVHAVTGWGSGAKENLKHWKNGSPQIHTTTVAPYVLPPMPEAQHWITFLPPACGSVIGRIGAHTWLPRCVFELCVVVGSLTLCIVMLSTGRHVASLRSAARSPRSGCARSSGDVLTRTICDTCYWLMVAASFVIGIWLLGVVLAEEMRPLAVSLKKDGATDGELAWLTRDIAVLVVFTVLLSAIVAVHRAGQGCDCESCSTKVMPVDGQDGAAKKAEDGATFTSLRCIRSAPCMGWCQSREKQQQGDQGFLPLGQKSPVESFSTQLPLSDGEKDKGSKGSGVAAGVGIAALVPLVVLDVAALALLVLVEQPMLTGAAAASYRSYATASAVLGVVAWADVAPKFCIFSACFKAESPIFLLAPAVLAFLIVGAGLLFFRMLSSKWPSSS